MDFSNDQEIADLLELSSDVIRSIQHAESQPAKTVGKSAIRKGNTSELRTAWEAETHPQAKDSSTPTPQAQAPDHTDGKGTNSTSNQLPDQPEDQSHDLPGTNTPQISPETTIGVNGTNGLEAALRKLEKQGKSSSKTTADSNLGRDPSPSKKGEKDMVGKRQHLSNHSQEQPNSSNPARHPPRPPHARLAQQAAQNVIHQAAAPQGIGGTEGNSQYPGDVANALWLNGATQFVPQSLQNPGSSSAHAGDAPEYALIVATMVETLKFVVNRLEILENRVAELTKFVSPIQQVKADVQIIKTSCAVIEGQLATVQILEPGHSSIRSLDEMRQHTKPAVVVQAGTACSTDHVIRDGMIVKDPLARPVHPDKWQSTVTAPVATMRVSQDDINMVHTLLDNFGISGPKRAKIEAELANVKDRDSLVRIKKRIMNA
nr:phosphoprotein [Avian metaavulavirus 6]